MVRRCVQKNTGLEFAAKIINTKKLSARGNFPECILQIFQFSSENELDKVMLRCSVALSKLSDPFFH